MEITNQKISISAHIDDVIIWSKDFESHLQHLDLVFQRLRMANLTLRPNKCEFAKPEILYLGHFSAIANDMFFVVIS
jgi:hypothetical protein